MKVVLCLVWIVPLVFGLQFPVVFNTWKFEGAAMSAWQQLESSRSAVDAVEAGCSFCERTQCDHTVGYGGSPDENNGISLDAMIIDGDNLNMGAVAGLKDVRHAISVARHVLEDTKHSLLVGEDATKFALNFNFEKETMHSEFSNRTFNEWIQNDRQPNFWTNVDRGCRQSHGPLDTICTSNQVSNTLQDGECSAHDTIGMLAIDCKGKLVAGTSSNNAKFRIPGRAGDAAIIGAGAYVKSPIGGAVATGDGDIMMRFLPSFKAVVLLELGLTPQQAAESIIQDIRTLYPKFMGALLVVSVMDLMDIKYGAACSGFENFPFCIQNSNSTIVKEVKCGS